MAERKGPLVSSPLYRIEWPKADLPENVNWAHSVSEEVQYAIDNDVLVPVEDLLWHYKPEQRNRWSTAERPHPDAVWAHGWIWKAEA